MSIKAVFFDLGGVIVRTEYQSPRQQLAERLGMEYDDLSRIVFDSETGIQATMGSITSGLGVDAQNLTGALRLYESAGMHIDQAYDYYEKELRPGTEISVQFLS